MNTTIATPEPARSSGSETAVRVVAPGRLHLGFLDLAGTLGRKFGSLGISLDSPATSVRLSRSDRLAVSGPDAERAAVTVERVARQLGLDSAVRLVVETALPPHSGLGSGTQLGLAVGAGLAMLQGRHISPRDIGAALGRGARSAIGIGAFTQGGVILDGGKASGNPMPPPILSRLPFPETWRIVLVYDHAHRGLSGTDEVSAMAALPPFPETLAGHLARLTVMVALPAVAEGDVRHFSEAVGEIQRRLGDHYASVQGGRYTSETVAEIMGSIEAAGVPGVGQSSWGPTGFAIFGDAAEAEGLMAAMRARYADRPGIAFDCVRGANRGAHIEWLAGG
ncbi:MAG TPA: beta-ribofuranosylaminobenzene 5'-phosphate synthase family protein [Xanthobacteraceae bacterium]|nr:beta-ribofuranosylaminobenzene 5'-phosphate synthase family protein [Xanthobacteraceae bacterium]